MKTLKVFRGDSYASAIQMFQAKGFNTIPEESSESFDALVFLGGTDVCPSVYGDKRHPKTDHPDKARDAKEVGAYKKYEDPKILKIGICRGAQLLNVLNGGRMVQHIEPRLSGVVSMHSPTDTEGSFNPVKCLVDHHQGMIANPSALLIGWLGEERYQGYDYSFYYPETNSFCFQPHPEWGHKETHDVFFEHLELITNRKDWLCAE